MDTYLVVRHQIGDFEQWKKVFDESDDLRRRYGIGHGWILRDIEDPHRVTVMLSYQSQERARQFMALDSLKDMMRRGGVKGEPIVTFVEQAAEVAELTPTTDAWPFC
ncbi:MAG: hypothetical protein LLG01_07415 [Planctomycetaceae bacterium]|nr:hypothetical protein [Planctomycetaceae bacterium]